MKKIITNILALVCMFSLFLGGAENPDGSCNLLWTLSCLAVAALSGWGLNKLIGEDEDENTITTK